MLVGYNVPSSKTLSLSELVSMHSEIPLVPHNCGAMQFPIGKLAEALEGITFVLRFELAKPLGNLIDNFSFILYFYIWYNLSLIWIGGGYKYLPLLENTRLHIFCWGLIDR